MMTKEIGVKTMKIQKEKPSARLNFPKDTVEPNGLSDIKLDEQITIVLKGVLSGVSTLEWDGSKRINLIIASCSLHGKEVKVSLSLDEALQQSERKK